MVYEGVLEGKHFRSHQAPEFGFKLWFCFIRGPFMITISVVKNFSMYKEFFQDNSCYKNTKFVFYDNNLENVSIPIRYNDFLKNYDYSVEDWFMFVHEDWKLLQNIEKKLLKLDKSFIYGVCGSFYNRKNKTKYLYGHIIQSQKDGSKKFGYGLYTPFNSIVTVDTVDCQCIIVHSSLIKKYNLKFDENLKFDLYSEDLSMNAKEKFNIETKVVPIKCHHYSYGNPTKDFYESLEYLSKKYENKKNTYATSCSENFIGEFVKRTRNLTIPQRLKRKINKIRNS